MKAYDRVSISLLSTVCQERLQTEHLQMTALLLRPLSVRTSKDISKSCVTITIGVPQGESFSCTLFNIFQNTLLEKLSRVPHHISDKAALALADDVILMSKTTEGLQLLLDNCTEWSADFQMAWNTAPGKSEVSCTASLDAVEPNRNPHPRIQYEPLCNAIPCVRQIDLRVRPPSRSTQPSS